MGIELRTSEVKGKWSDHYTNEAPNYDSIDVKQEHHFTKKYNIFLNSIFWSINANFREYMKTIGIHYSIP